MGAALLCGGRCGQVGSRVQILIGYEPKDSFIPLLLVCSCRPKLEVLFVLEIFCVCVFVCE